MAVVETRGLTKMFSEGAAAVDGVDLASGDGEFLVLLGPSGCGKTTLLRMIGGLEPPTAGDVLIGGRLVTGLPPRARQIAMVFQSYALYPHMTVYNNIAFPLKAQKVNKTAQMERVEWAAGILG
ncbi:MAG: ABC transporter ATP-binding protein, partial [Chloroflexota bacterium]|nr:ABC transporter ATP-binding protein [Chloroflexota bacterium]